MGFYCKFLTIWKLSFTNIYRNFGLFRLCLISKLCSWAFQSNLGTDVTEVYLLEMKCAALCYVFFSFSLFTWVLGSQTVAESSTANWMEILYTKRFMSWFFNDIVDMCILVQIRCECGFQVPKRSNMSMLLSSNQICEPRAQFFMRHCHWDRFLRVKVFCQFTHWECICATGESIPGWSEVLLVFL